MKTFRIYVGVTSKEALLSFCLRFDLFLCLFFDLYNEKGFILIPCVRFVLCKKGNSITTRKRRISLRTFNFHNLI